MTNTIGSKSMYTISRNISTSPWYSSDMLKENLRSQSDGRAFFCCHALYWPATSNQTPGKEGMKPVRKIRRRRRRPVEEHVVGVHFSSGVAVWGLGFRQCNMPPLHHSLYQWVFILHFPLLRMAKVSTHWPYSWHWVREVRTFCRAGIGPKASKRR